MSRVHPIQRARIALAVFAFCGVALGFDLDHAKLRRAGLDYHEFASLDAHDDFAAFEAAVAPKRTFAFSTRGRRNFAEVGFEAGDAFVFGAETRGLPEAMLARVPEAQRLRLPMRPGNRSLNLSNAVAVVVFEAWRQTGFSGSDLPLADSR